MTIPTVPFDATRHVIKIRETKEGREEWCTLGSLVDAERPLEAQHEAVGLDAIRAEIAALRQSPALPADFESRMISLIQQYAPPPQTTVETTAALTDVVKALVKVRSDLDESNRRIDILARSVAAVGEKLGV